MSAPGVFDTHCHLQAKYYADVDAVVARGRDAGVEGFVSIGSSGSVDVAEEAVRLARRHKDVWATVGYHPHEAAQLDDVAFAAVSALARDPRVVAVGETGLDYFYDRAPREVQRDVFARFIGLARDVGKPIVVHNRDSDVDCVETLRRCDAGAVGGVVHCFTSSWALARAALDLGMHLGFTGIVTFKRAEEVREVLRRAPRDRIVIETDSPYLAPVPHRGQQNEPALVTHVAACVADVLGIPTDEARRLTTDNARRLYRIA